MKKGLIIAALCLAIFTLPQQTQAASSLELVLMDSLWGGAIGALVGTATMAFMEHPGHHMDRVYQGAAIGIICGVGYGVYEIRPMFYSYTTPSGQQKRLYGLSLNMPLK